MSVNEIITLVITLINSLFVGVLSIQEIRREKRTKLENKKQAWFSSEVISDKKIQEHISNMSEVVFSPLPKHEICQKMNDVMMDFFYSSINYVAFFNGKYCEKLKQKIMAAVDNAMYSILMANDNPSGKEKDKILKIYRMKIIYLFYEFDIQANQKKKGER